MVRDYLGDYERQRIKIVGDVIPNLPYKSLDVACGVGIFSKMMFDKGHSVLGIDINKQNIDAATAKYRFCNGLKFICGDISNINEICKRGEYDFILALEIIEHLVNYKKFVIELHSLLKPGGLLVISTPNICSLEAVIGKLWAMREDKKFTAWDESHKRLFTSFAFSKLLRREGFEIIKIIGYHYNSSDQFPIIKFKIRLPFSLSSWFPLNMFGFNTIIIAKKHNTSLLKKTEFI